MVVTDNFCGSNMVVTYDSGGSNLVITDNSGSHDMVVNSMDVNNMDVCSYLFKRSHLPVAHNLQALPRAGNALSYDIVELEQVLTEIVY